MCTDVGTNCLRWKMICIPSYYAHILVVSDVAFSILRLCLYCLTIVRKHIGTPEPGGGYNPHLFVSV